MVSGHQSGRIREVNRLAVGGDPGMSLLANASRSGVALSQARPHCRERASESERERERERGRERDMEREGEREGVSVCVCVGGWA